MGVAGVGVGLGGGGEALGIGRGAFAIERAWRTASLENSEFLAERRQAFQNVVLGASFAPEQWSDAERGAGRALGALEFAVEGLGLREMRLGIRWDRAVNEAGKVDFGFYRPYLDYLFKNDLSVCLNVGPIRVFRWPEDHVPASVLTRIVAPPRGSKVAAAGDLAKQAMAYLDGLLDALVAEYGDKVRTLSAVQPENEAFLPFGKHEWSMSEPYLKQVIFELNRQLPAVPILMTSAGRLNLDAITGLFRQLVREDDRFRGRLISGFDYHYKTPRLDHYPGIRHLDPIAFAFRFPPAKTCEENIRDSREAGFAIEVSEGEAEPTGKLNSPGNSARDFRFMLLRCAENVLDRQRRSVLRIWGVEYLAKKALGGETTPEHEQILDLVRRLTDRAATAGEPSP